ncbi:biotin synthase-like enzyme [Psychroflexus sp. MBR-150]|jgi:biotin synthase
MIKHNWTRSEILDIYHKPLMELMHQVASIHHKHHNPNTIRVSTLLSIKTGGCPEDCGYCHQVAHKIERNEEAKKHIKKLLSNF